MQRGIGIILRAFLILFLFAQIGAASAVLPAPVQLFPDRILVNLLKSPGQTVIVSSTPNPMKVIIDSNLPIAGFAASQEVSDAALARIRYSELGEGRYRLVFDFNYQLFDITALETEYDITLEIAKTYTRTTERVVTRGVVYGHQRRADSFGPNVVNYIRVNLAVGNEVKLALAQNRVFGSENVSALSERYGAIAAVNGAFFSGDGRPVGLVAIDGELISEPYAARTALGIGPHGLAMERVDWQGQVFVAEEWLAQISGLNRPRLTDELIIYTPIYGSWTGTNDYGFEVTVVDGTVTNVQIGNSPIPPNGVVLSGHGLNREVLSQLAVGDEVAINIQLTPPWLEQGFSQIIGGGPRLVRDGELSLNGEEELFRSDVLQGRAPRTAIGVTASGELLLVTVNGRQPNISVGMSLAELGRLLIELGAVQAMNLDGGGSTTMVIRDLVLNLPSNGQERPVSNAILILAPQK